jgi:hypothetical protein
MTFDIFLDQWTTTHLLCSQLFTLSASGCTFQFCVITRFPFTDIDSAGKPRSGILRGNVAWFGSYSECLALSDAKYCISQIGVDYQHYNIVC